MNLFLSHKDKAPIYKQIVQSISQDIIKGTLKQEEMLPSIRSLSSELSVSVITVKKAYDELEKMGLIKTIPGKGSIVSYKEVENIKELKLLEIEKDLINVLKFAKDFGINKETIIEIINLLEV